MRDRHHRAIDRMFAVLLLVQWAFAIVLALLISPYTYVGETAYVHFHVKAAIGFGAIINALPLALIAWRPGWWGTRQVVAIAQMLWSAMLIMITGGRIETHFHVFGSLAFLASYRDWKVLPTATVIVAADHLARGLWWPDSVYGTANPEWWRFLEHAAWVGFEDLILVMACVRGVKDMRAAADHAAYLERTNSIVQQTVYERTIELEESLDRFRALVENTAAIPFELDRDTLATMYVAPQAAKLLDCTYRELSDAQFLANVVHPDDMPGVAAAIHAFARGERPLGDTLDYRLVTRAGKIVHVRTLLAARSDDRIRGITLDVTRQRQLESELQQAQKLESVGRLAAGVAHEINTPIQFVNDSVGFVRESIGDLLRIVELQREGKHDEAREHAAAVDVPYLNEQLPDALDRSLDGLERVAVIVRSMKVFAHQGGEMTAIDLNQAIASTLTIARHEYRYVADLQTEYGEIPPVKCEAGAINQVVLNIVLNAAHAIGDVVAGTESRGMITVRTKRVGDDAIITIADTGAGIPAHVRARIFEPFFTTKEVGKGTGQGLAIARSVIVDQHRGSLTFDSEPGRGTTFCIRIPIARELALKEAA
jgi:signal transduction histidine kinase